MKMLDEMIENKIQDFFLNENSTDDALGACEAAIKFYEKQENPDTKTKEVLDTLKGIKDYYKKNGSFTPGQARAIYNISKGISKITS